VRRAGAWRGCGPARRGRCLALAALHASCSSRSSSQQPAQGGSADCPRRPTPLPLQRKAHDIFKQRLSATGATVSEVERHVVASTWKKPPHGGHAHSDHGHAANSSAGVHDHGHGAAAAAAACGSCYGAEDAEHPCCNTCSEVGLGRRAGALGAGVHSPGALQSLADPLASIARDAWRQASVGPALAAAPRLGAPHPAPGAGRLPAQGLGHAEDVSGGSVRR
jgi:hypothetical protein